MTQFRPTISLCLLITACSDERGVASTNPSTDESSSSASSGSDDASPDGGGESTGAAPSSTGAEAESTTDTGLADASISAGDESSTGYTPPPHEEVACPAQVVQSAYCLTFEQPADRFVIIGADDGIQCQFVYVTPGMHPTSLAWIDDTVVTCHDNTQHVVRIDVTDGTMEGSDVLCSAVTNVGDSLFVAPDFDDPENFVYRMYESFDAIAAGDAGIPVGVQPFATVFAGADDTLFAAYFSTDHVELWDVTTAQQLPGLLLEGHDDQVVGLSVTDTSVFVNSADTLREFDRVTGDHVDDTPIGVAWTSGLACRPGL